MRIFCCAARITISLANSIPGLRNSSRRIDSREKPRMPQCASVIPAPKKRLRIQVSTGFPSTRCKKGMAPGWMVPRKREPITSSSPARRRSRKRGTSSNS